MKTQYIKLIRVTTSEIYVECYKTLHDHSFHQQVRIILSGAGFSSSTCPLNSNQGYHLSLCNPTGPFGLLVSPLLLITCSYPSKKKKKIVVATHLINETVKVMSSNVSKRPKIECINKGGLSRVRNLCN